MEGQAKAVFAASTFHFDTYTVDEVKRLLAEKKIPVRLQAPFPAPQARHRRLEFKL